MKGMSVAVNFRNRIDQLQQKMVEHDLDLVVYGTSADFQYLTGLVSDWRYHRGQMAEALNNLLVPREGTPILTLAEDPGQVHPWVTEVRVFTDMMSIIKGEGYSDFVRNAIRDLGVTISKVGLGNHVMGLPVVEIEKLFPHVTFTDASTFTATMRMIKEAEEIEQLRKVGQLTDNVLEYLVPKICKGVTQNQLELEAEFYARGHGASHVSFPPTVGFVKSGSQVHPREIQHPDVANPYTYAKHEGLEPGSSIAFDLGFVLGGYASDFGRSFYLGLARKEFREGYAALHHAVLETADNMSDGSMRVCDLYPSVEKVLDRLGYGNQFRKRLPMRVIGHNIGIEVHEPPWLAPELDVPLREGMVVALEPKLWDVGEYYLRVEDMILIGSRKAEFLTNFDRQLFQL